MIQNTSDRLLLIIVGALGLASLMLFIFDPTGCVRKSAEENAKVQKQNLEQWFEKETEGSLRCRWSRKYGVCFCHLYGQITPNNIPQDLCK